MEYRTQSEIPASIAIRDLTFISIQPNVGDGRLLTTLDENNVTQYFYIGADDEVILIAGPSITDTYNGIPVSLMRPFWGEVVIEATNNV